MTGFPRDTVVRCVVQFADSNGTLVDPGAVAFKYIKPDTTTVLTNVSASKDSTGVYHADVAGDTSGTWHYRFLGTGANAAAAEGTFRVDASSF